MARPRDARKERAILAAATELILRRGVRDTTMQEIATRAGVAVGTVYRYYADKVTLIRAIAHAFAREHHAMVGRVLAGEESAGEKLERYLGEFYDVWRPFGANGTGPEELAEVILKHAPETVVMAQREMAEVLRRILAEGQMEGWRVADPEREARWVALAVASFFPLAGTPSLRPVGGELGREDLVGIVRWLREKLAN